MVEGRDGFAGASRAPGGVGGARSPPPNKSHELDEQGVGEQESHLGEGDPVAALESLFVDVFQGRQIADGGEPARRPVFKRTHGIAHGRFEVLPDLPEELRIGVFALTLRNTRIEGNVLLRPGFRAAGGVSLHGAHIAGLVDLRAAKLSVNHRYALSAGGLHLAGALHINGGFRSEGPIYLRGARIGDGLHADGGVINLPEDWRKFDALNAEGAEVVPDVVLVPCVGFTAEGFRLGYGGGYFDRWMAAHPHATAVGVAWAGSEVSFAPEPHDQPLLVIVTERGVVTPTQS